tara:strand:- start:2363 stop:3700 length:1338 start_codon:yes stop_codon:yes gene_type:complete
MKNFFTYPVFLVLVLSIIASIFFGSILRHHYVGGTSLPFLQKFAVIIAEMPVNIKKMITNRTTNLTKPEKLTKHKDKKRFNQFIEKKRNALLVLPRYDHSLNSSIVNIIDLNEFEVIHTYKHNINEMHDLVKNTKEFPRLKIDKDPIRFLYRHPLILKDGSLVSDSDYSVEFKIDFCSNLVWINDEETFHHSKMLDHQNNIWVAGQLRPFSKHIKENVRNDPNFRDDAILKINDEGKILYKKSVAEILIENKMIDKSFFLQRYDPIHLNDIEPALYDSEYWKKGDVFLSPRYLSAIIHFRPSNNKVINYIKGPFAQQHDIDIISNKEISIFNNNNFITDNEYSEILIYNFETNKFRKLFNDMLKKDNFKTESEGLSHIFNDGALMVEEQNHGRIVLYNNEGEKEWEFVNKDKNGDIGFISWSRVIEDEQFIEKFKLLVREKKCQG